MAQPELRLPSRPITLINLTNFPTPIETFLPIEEVLEGKDKPNKVPGIDFLYKDAIVLRD